MALTTLECLSMDLVFTAGISSGAMQCMDVVMIADDFSEEQEFFSVILTASSSVLSLGNNETRVLIDAGN